RERGPTAGAVHHSRSGEVDRAVPEVQRRAQVRHPATAPYPHAVARVDDRAHRDLGEEEPRERDPFRDRADDDVAGGFHEHDLEQEQGYDADVVGPAALDTEAAQPDQTRAAVSEHGVEWRGPADVRERTDPAELEGKPHGV